MSYVKDCKLKQVLRITLDTNCIIKAQKPNEENYREIRELLAMHELGFIEIQVVAAAALENKRDIKTLEKNLENLSLEGITILPTPMFLGMAYLGYTYLAHDTLDAELREVWSILFPNAPYDPKEFAKQNNTPIAAVDFAPTKWRNYMCDALTVYEYSRNKGDDVTDILVTADGDDLLKKASDLEKIGITNIFSIPQGLAFARKHKAQLSDNIK